MTDQTAIALDLHRTAVPAPDVNACRSQGSTRRPLAGSGTSLSRTRTRCGPTKDPGFALASSVRRTDFSDSTAARWIINADVADTTRGLIPNCSPPACGTRARSSSTPTTSRSPGRRRTGGAGAATGLLAGAAADLGGLSPDPVVVRVDRPFLPAVRHTTSKAIYFLAQVARP
ncbi:hypothetical protein ACFWNN_10175 [Lentzea sp. NPDC058450]|uniref:hypothetical protein n=1 Tax=Lentzea sp. NPDC058450 TaxID=3346505 RepID=UPI003663DAF9